MGSSKENILSKYDEDYRFIDCPFLFSLSWF